MIMKTPAHFVLLLFLYQISLTVGVKVIFCCL